MQLETIAAAIAAFEKQNREDLETLRQRYPTRKISGLLEDPVERTRIFEQLEDPVVARITKRLSCIVELLRQRARLQPSTTTPETLIQLPGFMPKHLLNL